MEETQESKKPKVRDLISWKSLNRPARSYSKEVFTTLGAVVLLVSVILAFFQEWMLIFVSWAALFVFYQLTKVGPEEVEHKITTEGIVSMGRSYLWAELGPFWFFQIDDDILLHVAHRNIFGQLVILLAKEDQEKIRESLAEYLPYIETPEKSAADKLSDWFSKRFPITPKVTS